MKYKLVLTLIILIISLFLITGVVSAAQPQDCNNQGGIYCLDSGVYICQLPSAAPINCTIDSDQIVNLTDSSIYEFHFDNLNLGSNHIISFLHKDTVVRKIWDGVGCTNDPAGYESTDNKCHAKASCNGGGEGAYGEMGERDNYNCWGGDGGGGGAGGGVLIPGSNGGKGGDGGKGDLSFAQNCHYLPSSPYQNLAGQAGGNVKLIIYGVLDSLSSELSVSGQDGPKGEDGNNRADGCGSKTVSTGALGGAGGSGAGILRIFAPQTGSSASLKVSANGGAGGAGGNAAQLQSYRASGGAGGGGGGGNSGLVYASDMVANIITSSEFNAGAGGSPGTRIAGNGWSAGNGYGSSGAAGPQSVLPLSELNESLNNYVLDCNNIVDLDGDSFLNFEDYDCYKSAADSENWDVSGPINFLSYNTKLGVEPSQVQLDLGISWWNPSATNGLDASCGDDIETCIIDTTQPISCGAYSSSQTNCEFAGCEFNTANACSGTLLSCSEFENPSGNCMTTAPPWCIDSYFCTYPAQGEICECVDSYSAGPPPTDCSGVSIPDCKSQYGCSISQTSTCDSSTNQPQCNTLLDQTSCDAYYFCAWNASLSDQSFVDPTDKRYYCGKDYYETSSPVEKRIVSPEKGGSDWMWWDSYGQANAFKIHNFESTEFISNGEEWFYCDAANLPVQSNANPISKDSTFTSASSDGNFLCSSILNALVAYFTTNCTTGNFFAGDSDWLEYFTDYTSGITNHYVCQTQSGVLASQPMENFLTQLDSSGCLGVCGKADDLSYNSVTFTLGDMISDSCDGSFKDYYCDLFPCNDDGISTDFGGSTIGGTDYVDVETCSFNMEACLGGVSVEGANLCNDISYNEQETNILYQGYLCQEEYDDWGGIYSCVNKEYAYPLEVFPGAQSAGATCCVAEYGKGKDVCKKVEDPLSQLGCEDVGGVYLPIDEDVNFYYCAPQAAAQTDGDRCCFGVGWQPLFNQNSFGSITQNTSFICYDQSDNSLLAECCTDFAVCNNEQKDIVKALFAKDNEYLNGYYRKGGILHTLNNFDDKGDQSDGFKNYFARITPPQHGTSSGFLSFLPSLADSSTIRNNIDWSDFDYVEFDVAYNNVNISDGSNELRIHFVENGTGDECYKVVTNYLTNGKKELRWHHAVIPLVENNGDDCDGFVFEDIKNVYFSVTNNLVGNVKIGVDAFYLSEDDTKDNSDNYYCTGNFATWIDNLDGLTPVGFNSSALFTEYGPYAYACEAQASYDWTGRRCCGDQTKDPDYWNNNNGEYFEDVLSGCFHGTTVYTNKRVGDELNDIRLNNLMFYNGTFVACVNGDVNGQIKEISFNASQSTAQPLVTHFANPFEVRGDYICDSNGYWVLKESYSVSRIIASKMYNLSSDKDNYIIYCESVDEATPIEFGGDNYLELDSIKNNIKDFCTLQYVEGGKTKTMTGIGFYNTNVENMLLAIQGHADIHVGKTNINFPTICNGISGGMTNNADFFRKCDDTGVPKFGVVYNPDFNILLMAQAIDNPASDFDGMFDNAATVSDYIEYYWNKLIGMFKGWFGFGTASGDNINWTANTVLPLFSNSTSQYAENLAGSLNSNIPISGQVVTLQKLLIKKNGAKLINGFKESVSSNQQTREFITIEYVGFGTDLRYLADQYFSGDMYELQYAKGSNPPRQIIQLVNPLDYGYNKEGQEKTFEPKFSWQRIGPLLYFSEDSVSNPIQAQVNDGVVDLGEWCDFDKSNNPVFKYNNNTCEFWGDYTSGTVGCIGPTQGLDYSACI